MDRTLVSASLNGTCGVRIAGTGRVGSDSEVCAGAEVLVQPPLHDTAQMCYRVGRSTVTVKAFVELCREQMI